MDCKESAGTATSSVTHPGGIQEGRKSALHVQAQSGHDLEDVVAEEELVQQGAWDEVLHPERR